jgi:hypothetical protein
MKNVHEFDGKWKCEIKPKYTREFKKKTFSYMLAFFNNHSLPGHSGLTLIKKGIGKSENYDPISKAAADDILIEICMKLLDIRDVKDRLDICRVIGEQMEDMYTTGQCPQGRTTRLYQIFSSLT